MKYGYENVDLGELISNYKIVGNDIIVTFLNGNYYRLHNTKENELKILRLMLEQAQNRSDSNALVSAQKKRKEQLRWTIGITGFDLINIFSICATNSDAMRIFASILGILTTATAASWVVSYRRFNELVKELEKYDIYLSIKDQIDDNDLELFNGVKKSSDVLNINTLDDYSLRDIKTIQNNISNKQLSKKKEK